jgi:glycerophosphoryl diester phosphodiesterase
MKFPSTLLLIFFYCLSIAQVQPIQHGHAHNDYMHKRPLMEALENGFTSIEIDVFLHNDSLIVSHDAIGLDKKPDIESLYLRPIQKIIRQNGGTVYKGYSTPVIFMIDFKTSGDDTYAKLKTVLARYSDILAVFHNDSVIKPGPISILISGSKPFKSLLSENTSYATMDADISDMSKRERDRVVTRYSDPWGAHFTWNGKGQMPANQKARMDSLVTAAHQLKKQIRFYGIPDNPNCWKELLDAHLDWINTDHLKEYAEFWRAYGH